MIEKGAVQILIVEDSPTQAEDLRYTLEKAGYNVRIAKNGADALESMEQERPVIVITDIVMPVMDGFQLCRRIKGNERFRDIPVILLTALSEPEDVLRGLECGADNFVTKPYDEQYLLARIHHVLINDELRRDSKVQMGVEIFFKGQKYFVTSERKQILDLLLSTYETAVINNNELRKVQKELKLLNERLEQKVEERTAALLLEIEERKSAEAELLKHREHLEELVRARTSELEAFIYSVSHDLRSPLRSISGFIRILNEDYAGRLDDQARDYLNRVYAGAEKMGRLIEDLLYLSRISRRELSHEKFSISDKAASILANLRDNNPGRTVDVSVKEGLVACADPGLTEIVLSNLLGNAWKFTAKTANACIEFGSFEQDGKAVYYVKDNGAGFNATYKESLFFPFQRLHSEKDFEGTGIGLSIVERIVQRHGGKVWADGAVAKGATFFFTLN